MKRFFLLFVICCFNQLLLAQCNPKYYKLINSVDSNYTVLKTYHLDGSKHFNPSKEYPIQFAAVLFVGVPYQILFYDDNFKLKDKQSLAFSLEHIKKQQILQDTLTERQFSKVNFTCSTNGVYYLKFAPNISTCGAAVLAYQTIPNALQRTWIIEVIDSNDDAEKPIFIEAFKENKMGLIQFSIEYNGQNLIRIIYGLQHNCQSMQELIQKALFKKYGKEFTVIVQTD